MRDPDAFWTFCDSHHVRLVKYLSHYCGRVDVAEDIAQEALARAFRDWRKVSRMDRPDMWLNTVATNLANSYFRRNRRELDLLHDVAKPGIVEVVDSAEKVAVRQAVAHLPPKQKHALLLRYFADLTVTEIANAMGCPEGTVKSLLSRATDRLNQQLSEIRTEGIPSAR